MKRIVAVLPRLLRQKNQKLGYLLDQLEHELRKSYFVVFSKDYDEKSKRKIARGFLYASLLGIIIHCALKILSDLKDLRLPLLLQYTQFDFLPTSAAIMQKFIVIIVTVMCIFSLFHVNGTELMSCFRQFPPGMDESAQDEMLGILQISVAVVRVITKFSSFVCYIVVTASWVVNAYYHPPEDRLTIALLSSPSLIWTIFLSRYAFLVLIQVPVIIILSAMIVSIKMKGMEPKISRASENIDNISEVICLISDLNNTIILLNNLVKESLRDISNVCEPLISLLIVIVTSSQFPDWFRLLIIISSMPMFVVIHMCLLRCGRLFTESRNLIPHLYNKQLRITMHYQTRMLILKAIKLLSSSRRPICFTFPNDTVLTPSRSLSFSVEAISNTFLFLNNGFYKW